MLVNNSFTPRKRNECLRGVHSRDRNEPFFLAAVTLLAADDNARSALVLFTYLHRQRRKKEQTALQRQFAQMTCLLSARYRRAARASSALWRLQFKELAFLKHTRTWQSNRASSRRRDTYVAAAILRYWNICSERMRYREWKFRHYREAIPRPAVSNKFLPSDFAGQNSCPQYAKS